VLRQKSFDIATSVLVKPGYEGIHHTMSKLKLTVTGFMLPLVLLFGASRVDSRNPATKNNQSGYAQSGTLQKMIVENASVTMQVDLNGLNGSNSLVARPVALEFAAAANSFFPILVFNDLLRAAEPGSMSLIPRSVASLPVRLGASFKQLALEKLPSNQGFDLAVRDSKTGFTFFNVEGGEYDYDAVAHSFTITGGRLLISKQFANVLGHPSDSGAIIGKISVGAAMKPVEIDRVVNGKLQSAVMPAVGTVPGPDVIVGNLLDLVQLDNGEVNGRVGVSLGTDACNQGTENVGWFALPSNDHPFIPQNLYRMSGGVDNTQKFEQIGQSWGKHAFAAASSDTCGFGCNGVGGDRLGSGCSDAYGGGLNGWQDGIGSRGWVNPFTGNFPQGPTGGPGGPDDHTGHSHDVTSHRILVNVDDLNTSFNPGATYFAEASYIVPHEGTWCQSHPTECNMYNNASYRQYNVFGINQPFSFSAAGPTVRMQPAIMAWTGATVNQIEPDPGNDGIWFMGYQVTNPSAGVWHYEYALYNQNLDRAIQSFSVPLGLGANISNVSFHAPPQHPGWPHDGTVGDAGYSSTPWDVVQDASSITWSTETFATNQNANAIRFATLYNFRFDADQPPETANATVGFFKTGSPMMVAIQAPAAGATPTPTPTATATATPTPTATPRPTPSPRPSPPPRPRPTPAPRP
jgi:hypothetical protein